MEIPGLENCFLFCIAGTLNASGFTSLTIRVAAVFPAGLVLAWVVILVCTTLHYTCANTTVSLKTKNHGLNWICKFELQENLVYINHTMQPRL